MQINTYQQKENLATKILNLPSIPVFKIEVWQLFTVLTVIVSVASLLFFKSIQTPVIKQNEFVFLDQTKSKLFNLYHSSLQNPIVLTESASNFQGENDLENSLLNTVKVEANLDYYLQKDQQNWKEYKLLQDDLQKLSFFKDLNVLHDFNNSFLDYLNNRSVLYTKQQILFDETLNIKQEIVKISHLEIEEVNKNSFLNLEKSLNILNENQLSDESFLNYIEQWKNDINLIKESKNLNGQEVLKIRNNYNLILSYKFDQEVLFEDYKKSVLEFNEATKKLQEWQSDYAKNNYRLNTRLVLIEVFPEFNSALQT